MKQTVSIFKHFINTIKTPDLYFTIFHTVFQYLHLMEILNWSLGNVVNLANVITFINSIYAHWHHF